MAYKNIHYKCPYQDCHIRSAYVRIRNGWVKIGKYHTACERFMPNGREYWSQVDINGRYPEFSGEKKPSPLVERVAELRRRFDPNYLKDLLKGYADDNL